ncbi:MAG: MerR family transcriptional regulator [Rhizobiales bacterium]|nr:MerR family transcriptional regulator [Hyphomicrobiales bacterium]
MQKSPNAFRTISEAATELDVPQHVLRFWETKFKQIKPMKRGGGRRFYRPQDVDLIKGIKYFLYGQGYTIKGVQKILASKGVVYTANVWHEDKGEAPVTNHAENINIPEALLDGFADELPIEQSNPTPSDFVNEANPISYASSIETNEAEIYKHAQERFNIEKDAKIKTILTELQEIKQILKDSR